MAWDSRLPRSIEGTLGRWVCSETAVSPRTAVAIVLAKSGGVHGPGNIEAAQVAGDVLADVSESQILIQNARLADLQDLRAQVGHDHLALMGLARLTVSSKTTYG